MLSDYSARSGRFDPVFTLEIQTLPKETDRLLDAIMHVHPLAYGRYERNASVSAVGAETTQPMAQSTTTTHKSGYSAGATETYPMVELKISIARDLDALERVMDVILDLHHYEQPVIYLREDWASRAAYDPNNTNPNRWWNNGRGLPDQISQGEDQ
ncbi:hypothetical protein [uncultured Roseobacter sp.]|uniref:hypothetical protein n=1 Tax=uncultured Roseobacter sp. TaxID=114847 RepID=UPI002620EF7F|nr:hypothetical protein [uncultured Roseobacter sp.]